MHERYERARRLYNVTVHRSLRDNRIPVYIYIFYKGRAGTPPNDRAPPLPSARRTAGAIIIIRKKKTDYFAVHELLYNIIIIIITMYTHIGIIRVVCQPYVRVHL